MASLEFVAATKYLPAEYHDAFVRAQLAEMRVEHLAVRADRDMVETAETGVWFTHSLQHRNHLKLRAQAEFRKLLGVAEGSRLSSRLYMNP